ncbi:MAG: tetratricopeptide repeat protein, partial [Xenococcaceae cyanobacterium]
MKILILASNPRKDLKLEREIQDLPELIERSRNQKDLDVKLQFAVRPKDLQGLLLKHQPEIVHFCGHGTGQQGLVLQNDTGLEKLVSTDALSNLFELCSQWVKCVLLNACYSEVQADAIVQHIDYAIGMNREIGDNSAIADYTQAIQIDQNWDDISGDYRGISSAYNNRGNVYHNLEEYQRAIADFTQAIALEPNSAHAYNTRLGRLIMKKALYLAFSDRSIMNRIASNADFSSLRSRNLPSR